MPTDNLRPLTDAMDPSMMHMATWVPSPVADTVTPTGNFEPPIQPEPTISDLMMSTEDLLPVTFGPMQTWSPQGLKAATWRPMLPLLPDDEEPLVDEGPILNPDSYLMQSTTEIPPLVNWTPKNEPAEDYVAKSN